jgi:hypothetical protein
MASAKPQITSGLVDGLKLQLEGATVLTRESPGYEESIKRWSETGEKSAV